MADTLEITGADMQAVADSLATPADATATSTPASTETTPPASATTAPVDEDLTSPEWGDIPPARRPTIAANIRNKAITKAQQEWDQQYGWAKTIDRNELEAFRREQSVASQMSPADYVLHLWQRVQNDPQHGPQLRSQAARILGQRAQAQGTDDPMPAPDIPTDTSQGQPVVYSAAQLQKLLEWQSRRTEAGLLQKFAPMRDQYEQIQTERQQAALEARSTDYAQRTLKAMEGWPAIKDHMPTIMQKYAALGYTDPRTQQWSPDPNDPRTEGEKLRDIYAEVVLPTLSQTARQQAVEDITRKAGASTVTPRSAPVGEPYDFRKNPEFTAEDFRQVIAQKGGKW